MIKYPSVTGEYETLEALHQGKSIARFGDGEWKLCKGANCVSQKKDPKLQAELMRILQTGSTDKCLVGIPPLDNLQRLPEGKKRDFWTNQVNVGLTVLHQKAKYHSSFITRPDNAPWIDTPEFYNRLLDLWRGKEVTFVFGSDRSLYFNRGVELAARSKCVFGLYKDTYMGIDIIEERVRAAENKTVVISLGASGTCLAWRLAGEFQAIDVGHFAMKSFFKKGKELADA